MDIDKSLLEISQQTWYARPEEDENDVPIMRRDDESRGCWIGPIMTVTVGSTTTTDDGEWALDLHDQQGAILQAAMQIPQLLRLLLDAQAKMAALNGIHFDTANECGKFLNGLRDDIERIIGGFHDRPPMGKGTHMFL